MRKWRSSKMNNTNVGYAISTVNVVLNGLTIFAGFALLATMTPVAVVASAITNGRRPALAGKTCYHQAAALQRRGRPIPGFRAEGRSRRGCAAHGGLRNEHTKVPAAQTGKNRLL